MNTASLKEAKDAAKLFLARVKTLKEKQPASSEYYWAGKYSAAVKRASMDLTRALANLRRPM